MSAEENKELEQEVTESMTEVDGVATENPDDVAQPAQPAPSTNAKKDVLTDSFETVLTNFFKRYHERKVKFVPELVERYKGREEQVLIYLANRYRVNPSTIAGTKNLPNAEVRRGRKLSPDGTTSAVKSAAGAATDLVGDAAGAVGSAAGAVADMPKKKSKMGLIIIVLIVVLGGGGAGAYFSGMLGGGAHDDAATHEDAESHEAESHEAPAEEPVAEPEEAEATPETEEAAPAEGEEAPAEGEADGTAEDSQEAAEAIDAVVGH